MKVARWYNNQDIRIEEMPKPAPGPDDLLIKNVIGKEYLAACCRRLPGDSSPNKIGFFNIEN